MNDYIIKPVKHVLEIGGGINPLPFKRINMDILDHMKVDIKHNLEDIPYPFEDNSFNTIIGLYIIEHISWRKIRIVLEELYRILNYNGTMILTTSNLLEQAKYILRYGVSQHTVEMVYGSQEYPDYAGVHKTSFSPAYIETILSNIGFTPKIYTPMPNIFIQLEEYNKVVPLYPGSITDILVIAEKRREEKKKTKKQN